MRAGVVDAEMRVAHVTDWPVKPEGVTNAWAAPMVAAASTSFMVVLLVIRAARNDTEGDKGYRVVKLLGLWAVGSRMTKCDVIY